MPFEERTSTTRPRVAVGSTNQAKIDAIREGFTQSLGPVLVEGVAIAGAPEQPRGDGETRRGAEYRAAAVREALPQADYWVGLEGESRRSTARSWSWPGSSSPPPIGSDAAEAPPTNYPLRRRRSRGRRLTRGCLGCGGRRRLADVRSGGLAVQRADHQGLSLCTAGDPRASPVPEPLVRGAGEPGLALRCLAVTAWDFWSWVT